MAPAADSEHPEVSSPRQGGAGGGIWSKKQSFSS
ncbi:hypothetical protein [Achromobacter xylosoxidans]